MLHDAHNHLQDALLARLPRTAGAMREAACRLDRTALAAGGPVTRALALQVAGAMEAAEHDGLTETYHLLYDRSARPEADVSPDGPLLL